MENTAKQQTNNFFNLWDRIEVLVGDDGEQGVYVSRIEEFNNEGLVITKPDFVGGHKLLTANARVFVQFMRPDALYRLPARVRAMDDKAKGMLQIYSMGDVERVQRRQYVRIDMEMDLKYALIKRPEKIVDVTSLEWKRSRSVNISAGGMLLRVDGQAGKGDLLILSLSEYEKLEMPRLVSAVCCRIVRMEEGRYAGVEFILDRNLSKHFSELELTALPSQIKGFTPAVQNRLVRFVFEQQVKDRQKGLL